MPPAFKNCPICSRGFGSSSLEIHIPQCQAKTLANWKNDPNTRDRPMPPGLAMALGVGGGFGGGGGRAPSSGVGSRGGVTTGPSNLASKMGGGASSAAPKNDGCGSSKSASSSISPASVLSVKDNFARKNSKAKFLSWRSGYPKTLLAFSISKRDSELPKRKGTLLPTEPPQKRRIPQLLMP